VVIEVKAHVHIKWCVKARVEVGVKWCTGQRVSERWRGREALELALLTRLLKAIKERTEDLIICARIAHLSARSAHLKAA
jgi:hypothetical protein